jgi:hypothetical protein
MKGILYTRFDGGVSICYPTENCIRWLSSGGHWGEMSRGFLETQIERTIAEGRNPDIARRFVHGLAFGGLSSAEAFEVIRDRDCGHLGTAHETCHAQDLPDRWFRDAWIRSHNGGPIRISLPQAKRIHWARISQAIKAANDAAEADLDAQPLVIDAAQIKSAIRKASDVDDLRRIWPDTLRVPA